MPRGWWSATRRRCSSPTGWDTCSGWQHTTQGGCLEGRAPSDRPTLRYLRADLPLQPGYVVTIEPGIYFIRALLEDADLRERYRGDVVWERVDALLDFGGIRIEDDVLVGEEGPEVLSAATPKALAAIDELRGEAIQE